MKKLLYTLFLYFLCWSIIMAQEIPQEVMQAYQIAAQYKAQGKYTQAIEYYEQAVSIYAQEVSNEDPNYAILINNLALLYADMGNYSQAEPLYKKDLEITAKFLGKEHPDYATSLNNLAELYRVMGNYSQAEPLLLEALEIKARTLGKKHPDYAILINNLALLYADMGNYSQAETLYREGLEITAKVFGKEHPDYAISLNNFAELYRTIGNYSQAEPLYREALEVRAKVFGKEHPDYAQSLNNLAALYYSIDNYSQAETLLLEALEIKAKALGKEHSDYAASLNNLALLYANMGNYSQAEPLYREDLEITAKAFGKEHPDYATSLNNLALLYADMGNYSQAEILHKEVKEIRAKVLGKEHPDYTNSLNSLAFLYANIGNYPQAEILYREAIQNKINQIENLLPALSEKERKSYIESIQFYFESFYAFALEYYEQKPEIVEELFNLQLITKALIFQSTQKMQEQILNSNDAELIEEYNLWKAKRGELARAIQMTKEEQKSAGLDLEALQAEANQMEKELSKKSTELSGFLNLKALKWQDAQAKLKKGEALVEMIRLRTYEDVNDTVYVALILTPESQIPQLLSIKNGKELEGKYKDYYSTKIGRQQEDKYSYNQYWKPLKTYLEGVKKVYFSPDGVYHQINLLTLQNPETEEYLIDEVEIQLLGSPKDLIAFNSEKQNFKDYQIYLFGYPQYADYPNQKNTEKGNNRNLEFEELLIRNEGLKVDTTLRFINAGGKISILEGTLNEINNISKLAENQGIIPKKFLDLEANEENIKELKSPTFLHIATHGFFLENLPKENQDRVGFTGISEKKFTENPLLRSGLLLAGAEKTWQGHKFEGEDGILTAEEVIMIDLSGTELVVLSACETGLGEINNGEGVYGLQRSFQQAGAKSVIMSLWKVSDVATQKMMSLFYENLLIKKQSTREAFKNAQLELREEFSSPYFWGAFVFIGQ